LLNEEPPAYVPAPRALMGTGGAANSSTGTPDAASNISKALPANIKPLPVNVPKAELPVPGNAGNATNNAQPATTASSTLSAPVTKSAQPSGTNAATGAGNSDAPPLRRLDDTRPAKSSFIGPQLETQNVVTETPRPVALNTNANQPSQPNTVATVDAVTLRSAAGLMLLPKLQEMKVGERRRLALLLKTDAPLGLLALTFKFDPRAVRISEVSTGNLLATGDQGAKPIMTQSVDAKGLLLVSIAPPSGAQPLTGAGILIFIDIEALTPGESSFSFDKNNVHLIAADGRAVLLDLSEVKVTVKQ
jgi:hypothetical protein